MVHLIFKINKEPILPPFYKNLELIREQFKSFTPQMVEEITEVPRDVLKDIVEKYCLADSAVCYGRIGVSTQQYGSLCQYLIYLINMLTDNFDRPGGFMLPSPAIDVVKAFGPRGTYEKFDAGEVG